jgi:RNA polymerase sigma-70 factor (ECF subfamily)
MDGGLVEHVPHVYRLALRLTRDMHLAEDLTQETFLRAWQRCQQLKNKQAVRTWLYRIAVNLAKDHSRRAMALSVGFNPLEFDADCSKPTPLEAIVSKDELELTLKILDRLPDQQRIVLFLIAVEDLSLGDVCEVLEITMSSAKANLSLARKRMREEMAKRDSRAILRTSTAGGASP